MGSSLVTEMISCGHISSNSKITDMQGIATQLQSYFPPVWLPSCVHRAVQLTRPIPEPPWRYWYHFTDGQTKAQRGRWSSKGHTMCQQQDWSHSESFMWTATFTEWPLEHQCRHSQELVSQRTITQLEISSGLGWPWKGRRVLQPLEAPHTISQRGGTLGKDRSRFNGHQSLYM